MKRVISMICLLLFVLAAFAGCTADPAASSDESLTESIEESGEESVMKEPDKRAELYWDNLYASGTVKGTSDVYHVSAYLNGVETNEAVKADSKNDVRYLFNGLSESVAVVYPEGYILSLPGNDITADFSLGQYRSQYMNDDYCLTVTFENQNPYGANEKGYSTYINEWLVEQIEDTNFMAKNRLLRTRKIEEHVVGDYTVKTYCMAINQGANIKFPYYNIAIIRPVSSYAYFYLMVMKTAEKNPGLIDEAVAGFREINKQGVPSNSFKYYECKQNPNWNAETKAYYEKLLNQTTVDFGAFPYKHEGEYADWLFSEEGIGTPDVYMTYQHMGWYGKPGDVDEFMHRAEKYAGGNGFDNKPVLSLVYQFTETNNSTKDVATIYDILRGKKDNYLRQVAQAIKSYQHPVLFRVNNEMNTDWTDYCGMCTMIDPDIFQMTWRRMYDIFTEEGVDNCIWIFNPATKTCPYCNWGEALCYFPGEDYVQMFGCSPYEFNNYRHGENPESFKSLMNNIEKVYSVFNNYPWVLGEYACAAGGETYYDWDSRSYKETVLGRNLKTQTKWVTDMINCFKNTGKKGNEAISRVKVAIWFSASDYADPGDGSNKVVNYLRLDEGTTPTNELLRNYLIEKNGK